MTVYHGDHTEILPSIAGESIDLIWTDPPYGHANHDGDFNARLNDHRGIKNKPIKNDTPETFRETLSSMLNQAARILKKAGGCCCCCCGGGGGGPRPTFAWVANQMDTGGLSFFHSVIWDKINPGLGIRFRRQHEMVMVAHRAGGRLNWNKGKPAIPNIVRISPPRKRLHPNEKPIDLPGWFIGPICPPGGIVLDPFMGSGTTLIAAKQVGRRAIGIELDESFCEIAAKRLSQGALALGC